ncbi:MAG: aspartate aminotransferase family protein [Patescibacteria group bacterium]
MMGTRMETLLEKVRKYGARHYPLCPIVFSQGQGVWVKDANGNIYLDACAGYSANNLGHANPEIDGVIRRVLTPDEDGWGLVNIVPNSTPTEPYAEFVEHACAFLDAERVLAKNGGVEGVEVALKIMREWGYTKKPSLVPIDQGVIVTCDGNFHGRTITAVSFSSNQEYRDPFGPLTPGFISIPYGDSAALERVLKENPNVVGFLVEPIQGEGGVRIPPDGYLRECYALCKKYDIIFCADEIQTGLGRTGALLACSHENVVPDIFILGKSLGGGRIPTSATFAKEEFMVLKPGQDGSTYGGNALAMTVANRVLTIVRCDKLCERSLILGGHLLRKLKRGLLRGTAKTLVKEVRGRGLMLGVELAAGVNAGEMITALLNHGVMTKDAHGVIRITPPLVITKEECDELAKRIILTFRDVACAKGPCLPAQAGACGKKSCCS